MEENKIEDKEPFDPGETHEQPEQDTSTAAVAETAVAEERDAAEEGRSALEKQIEEMGLENPEQGAKPSPGQEEPQQSDEIAKPSAAPAQKLTSEQEEEELVKTVASERGRQRIGELLRAGRQAQSGIEAIRRTVSDAGLDQESFANLLTITKLCSSQNSQEVDRGLQMLESVRAALYKNIGREAPGVDLLQGYDDLQKKVEDFSMDRKDALAIAQARHAKAQQQAQQQEYVRQQQEQQAFTQKIHSFQTETAMAFAARQNDIDFNSRIAALKQHFTPERIAQFVQQIPPERWKDTLLYMYDTAGAAAPRNVGHASPIAGRPSRASGVRVDKNMAATPEGIAARMEQLGL